MYLHQGQLFFAFLFLYFCSNCLALRFLIHDTFQGCHLPGKRYPFSSSPSTFFISRHISYLLCYVNEGTACGLECAVFC